MVVMRKRTKRKVWGLVNPIQHAIEGAEIPMGQDAERLLLGELSAIESFRLGQAVEEDWQLLSVMTAISALMAYEGKQAEPLEAARQAWKCLDDILKRRERTGKWGCSGLELQVLRDMIEWHEAQRKTAARSVYESAIHRSKGLLQNKQQRMKVFKESE